MKALKLLSLASIFITILISESSSLPFANLLGIDDYAIVGIENCEISTQIKLEDRQCCHHMSDFPPLFKPECTKLFAVLYVPPERDSKEQPKIIAIFDSLVHKSLVYGVKDIEYPSSNNVAVINPLKNQSFSFFTNNTRDVLVSDIVGVVYDHLSRSLYIIFKGAGNRLFAYVYLIEPGEKTFLHHSFLHMMDVNDYFLNTEWSSDMYSQKFYYHKSDYDADLGHHLGKVYSIPYASLIYHLKHGIAGEFVKDYADESRFSVQVTNGLLYSTAEQSTEDSFYRYLTPLSLEVNGVKCTSGKTRFNDFFFVLTGWELCKLRDREQADFNTCVIPSVLSDSLAETQSNESGYLWAITLAVIVNAIILLIILYVVCKRKNADKMDNGLYASGKPTHSALLSPEEIFQRRRTTSTLTEF